MEEKIKNLTIILFLLLYAPLSAENKKVDLIESEAHAILIPGSGTYSKKISTQNKEAQQFFDQGLRLAWGFYFPESIASYLEAARHDPDHPMPYWGMAHAMGPNPNSRYSGMPDDPKGEGLKAIKKAMDRIENASHMEAKLIKALYTLYDKDANPDAKQRDRAYLAEMRKLNRDYPNDPDIAALYANSYMSIQRWNYWGDQGKPISETLLVAEALEHIMSKDLSHPGVLHLHIHLIEASAEPERALVSADNLERTIPIVGHVVHMPSHIYIRVGQYKKALEQNIRSQKVDKEFAKIWGDLPLPNLGTYPLSHKIHSGHALDFVRYAASVQGNYNLASESAWAMANSIKDKQIMIMQGQKRVAAPWQVLKTFGKWDEILKLKPKHSGTPYLDGIWSYVKGSAYLSKRNTEQATRELNKLKQIINSPDVDKYRAGATPVSRVLKAAAYGLEGEIFLADSKYPEAIEAFTLAVELEDQNNYTEPPDWPHPMRLYLGSALISAQKFKEAENVYRRDLDWHKNNGWSLFGLHQSLLLQGKTDEAETIYKEFLLAWQQADIKLYDSYVK
jgi:tetratricopeptide (TPR) repeat protein